MPSYGYECPGCGRQEQRIVPVALADEQVCECGCVLTREFPPRGLSFAMERIKAFTQFERSLVE